MTRWLGTPSTPEIRHAMQIGLIDAMIGPYQGNIVPWGVSLAADVGTFTEKGPRANWMGHEKWLRWLTKQVERYGTEAFHFALAPDVPFDAARTLDESVPWLETIRDLGLPAGFAAQNGCDALGLPWKHFDVLFLAGDTAWKVGPTAHRLAQQAKDLGKRVHMGRVNSLHRLQIAEWFGCDTADGTFLKFGPDINLGRVSRWLGEMSTRPSLAYQED